MMKTKPSPTAEEVSPLVARMAHQTTACTTAHKVLPFRTAGRRGTRDYTTALRMDKAWISYGTYGKAI